MKHEWGGGTPVMDGHRGPRRSMKGKHERLAGAFRRSFRQPVDHTLNAVLGIVRQDGKFKEGGKEGE
jgi:hypothetical protein